MEDIKEGGEKGVEKGVLGTGRPDEYREEKE